jgi:O-antigen/teichoic acid export membrane protein
MKREYVLMLLLKVVAACLLFAIQPALSNTLELAQYGLYSYIISLVTVLPFFATWGTQRYCLKEFSLFTKSTFDKDKIKQKTNGIYSVIVINTVLITIFLIFYLPQELPKDIHVENTTLIIALAIFITFSRAIAMVSTSVSKGLHKVLFSELVLSIIRPLLFLASLGVVYLLGAKMSVETALFYFGVSFFVIFIISSLRNVSQVGPVIGVGINNIRKIYSASFYFFLVGVGLPLLSNINNIQLGSLGTSEQVALFSASSKVVTIILLGLVSANLLIAPKLSPLYYSGNIGGMRLLIRNNNRIVLLLTIPPVLLVLFFAEQILGIFGQDYISAAPFLRILVIGHAVSVLCGPVLLTATMTGYQKTASIVIISVCLISWSLCFILIPKYGAMGAVYSAVFGNICLNLVLAIILYRKIELNVTMLNMLGSNK